MKRKGRSVASGGKGRRAEEKGRGVNKKKKKIEVRVIKLITCTEEAVFFIHLFIFFRGGRGATGREEIMVKGKTVTQTYDSRLCCIRS